MLAYEAWKVLDHKVGPKKRTRASWNTLTATQRFKTFGYSEDFYRGLKKDIDSGNLYKRLGLNPDAYAKWIEKKRRQQNISNLIQFLGKVSTDRGQIVHPKQ